LGPPYLRRHLDRRAPSGAAWSLRLVEVHNEYIAYRQGVLQPLQSGWSRGAFLTLMHGGGMGYAAASDLSPAGLAWALEQALAWAQATAELSLLDPDALSLPSGQGHYAPAVSDPWEGLSLPSRLDLVRGACAALAIDPRIVDWSAHVDCERVHTTLVTSTGGCLEQGFSYLLPGLAATADDGHETQRRSLGWTEGRQGGLGQLAELGFPSQARRVAEEAIELLGAPPCPAGEMDLVLTPSQMALQVHESIGHPLELDRILGDERNYAGTSFVTPEMLGGYRYGSPLLNVTFDPSRPEQLASYGFDDEGTRAERVYLIREGILERALGGALSQRRAGVPGTANARACHWNRPPIDRMANINLEPGDQTLDQLIAGVERGVLMDTNRSWSIDDSRNKFQFGCERGRLIRDGELGPVVRNPNYRGISAGFWHSLDGVGDATTLQVLGVTNCGKGEPNQSLYVGHATPACRFRRIAVLGPDD
jgi:predicted Zn-dependent protease